ncbi:hypothetical protein [Capnocytophaga leadbetteri]|jgi:hypothetical protein|nr:hypothetical protein [Capnocytophaga leadbetteri]
MRRENIEKEEVKEGAGCLPLFIVFIIIVLFLTFMWISVDVFGLFQE